MKMSSSVPSCHSQTATKKTKGKVNKRAHYYVYNKMKKNAKHTSNCVFFF